MSETEKPLNLTLSPEDHNIVRQLESSETPVIPYHPLAFQPADTLVTGQRNDINTAIADKVLIQEGAIHAEFDLADAKFNDPKYLEPSEMFLRTRLKDLSDKINDDARSLSAQNQKPFISILALQHCKQLFDNAIICAGMEAELNQKNGRDISENITDRLNGLSPDTPTLETGANITISMRF